MLGGSSTAPSPKGCPGQFEPRIERYDLVVVRGHWTFGGKGVVPQVPRLVSQLTFTPSGGPRLCERGPGLGLLLIQLSVLTRLEGVGAIQSISSTSSSERFESHPLRSTTVRPATCSLGVPGAAGRAVNYIY